MSLKIPKGRTYTFNMVILQSNSYLPKDLLHMDDALSTFTLVELVDLIPAAGTIALAKIPDEKVLLSYYSRYCYVRISIRAWAKSRWVLYQAYIPRNRINKV